MRETGGYWVRFEKYSEWVLASWDGFSEVWWVGMDCYDSRAFAEVNEQRVLPPHEQTRLLQEVLDLGMEVRSYQLSGHSGRSGKQALEDFLSKRR